MVVTPGIIECGKEKYNINNNLGKQMAFCDYCVIVGNENKQALVQGIKKEIERTDAELARLLASFEAEELSDIQPEDMNESEILPDPAVYDTLRFVVKDLEADGKVHCPCGNGQYDLRFAPDGIEVYCQRCGGSYKFTATTPAIAEEYLSIDEIKLK